MPIVNEEQALRAARWAKDNPDDPRRTQVVQELRAWKSQGQQAPADPSLSAQQEAATQQLDALRTMINSTVSQITTTPHRAPPPELPRPAVPGGRGGTLGLRGYSPASDNMTVLRRQAHEAGVDVASGASLPARFNAAVADVDINDPGLKMLVLDKMLRPQADVPEGIPVVFREENTGSLSYLRRVTEDDVRAGRDSPADLGKLRQTLVDPGNLEVGDLMEWAPDIGKDLAEAGAFVGTTAVTRGLGAPLALSASTAAGAMVQGWTRPMRVKYLKTVFGLTDAEIEQTGTADNFDWLNAGVSVVGEGGMALLAGLTHLWKQSGRTLTQAQFDEAVRNFEKSREALQEIEDVTGIQILNPDEPSISRARLFDSFAVNSEAGNALNNLSPKERRASRVGEQNVDARLTEATRNLLNGRTLLDPSTPKGPTGIVERTTEGETARQVSTTLTAPIQQAALMRQQAERRFQQMLEDFPTAAGRGDYVTVQNSLQEAAERSYSVQKEAWDRFDELSGHGQLSLREGSTAIRSAAANLIRQARASLSVGSGTKKMRLVEDLEPLLTGDTVDMKQLHILHSELKQTLRTLERNPENTIGFAANDVRTMIDAIEGQVERGLMIPGGGVPVSAGPAVRGQGQRISREIQEAWMVASEASQHYKRVAQAKAVQDLIRLKPQFNDRQRLTGFRFRELPNEIRTAIFQPNDAGLLHDIFDAVGDNPALRSALSADLQSRYLLDVAPEGKWNRLAHERFMTTWGDHMELLFGAYEARKIVNVESMALRVQQLSDRSARIANLMQEAFGKGWDPSKGYSTDLVQALFTDRNINHEQLANIMKRVERIDPQLAGSMRANAATWFEAQLIGAREPKGSNAFFGVTRQYGDKLNAMFGRGFTDDLNKIGRVVEMFERAKAPGPRDPAQPAWIQVTRTMFGPLSNIQRRITAGVRINRVLTARKGLTIISDPDKLRAFVRLEKMDPQSLAFKTAMFNLLGKTLYDQMGFPPLEESQPTVQDLRDAGAFRR